MAASFVPAKCSCSNTVLETSSVPGLLLPLLSYQIGDALLGVQSNENDNQIFIAV